MTAHELTHGVTYYTSNLVYRSDSGAMNEAMSDIFAATIERVKGGKGNRNVWIMGEDITLSGSGVRNMVSFPDGCSRLHMYLVSFAFPSQANPAQFGHYDWYPSRYQGSDDYGGVHSNSGTNIGCS